ncbi:CHAT domain-containing protein [Streptomyces sp. NPDC093510]|uniref:CHAT domain-containing protein n=1 Tax=Streptomyces sp. NPDC093510 TaxID=3155199 RepID=UPI003422AC08
MPDVDVVVNRMLARFDVSRSSEVNRALASATDDPRSWLVPTAGLLRASWNGDGKGAAAAAAALMGLALDTGAHDHPERARWTLHLWLAEHTLSALYGDYRLSQEVRHRLAAQTQNRAAGDPVAVAATYPDLPPPRHFEAPSPIEREAERLVAGLPQDDLGRATLLVRLAQAAYQRYESGNTAQLTDAWARARAALSAVTPDHIEAAAAGRTAAYAGVSWFRLHLQDRSAVETAVRAGRLAVEAVHRTRGHGAPYDRYEAATGHFVLAIALMSAAADHPDLATVEEAIEHLEAFRTEGPPDDRGMYSVNMASMLSARGFLAWSPQDVMRSDELWAALEGELPTGHPLLPHIALKRKGAAKLVQLMRTFPFNASGLIGDLKPLVGGVLTELPPLQLDAPLAPPGYASPGSGTQPGTEWDAESQGSPFSAMTSPVAEPAWPPGPDAVPAPGPHPATGPATQPYGTSAPPLADLPPDAAAVWRSMVAADGTPLDPRMLALAEEQLRARLAQPGPDDGRGWMASVLVHVMAIGYTLSNDPTQLEGAVRCGDEVLADLPRSSPHYIDLVCTVENYRHMYGVMCQHSATVERAVSALRWARERLPEGSIAWLSGSVTYAHALSDLSGLLRDPVRSAEAVHVMQDAYQCLQALPEQAAVLGTEPFQGRLRPAFDQVHRAVLATDAYVRADNDAFESAQAQWDPAAEQLLPPTVRFENARLALVRAVENRIWEQAADAAATALDVLPLLTSRALDRNDRQNALRAAMQGRPYITATPRQGAAGLPDQITGTSLGRTGCAVAIAAGRAEQALTILEQGRAVLMAQDLEARTDVSDLAEAFPEAAARFTAASERMLHAESGGAGEESARVREQHIVAEEWRQLLTDIRGHPGFERFLLPPTLRQLRDEAAEGPIVMINVDPLRCDALVVRSRDIRHVPLDVTEGNVADRVQEFLAAVGMDRDSPREQEQAREVTFRTLEWLWDAVAEPVLDAAGFTTPLPHDTPRQAIPRLWWSASGPLAHLPLHAAGYQRKAQLAQQRSVLDRVASSYTPSIRALRHARQAAVPEGVRGSYLAVAQPTGAGGAPGASAREVASVARALTALRILDGPDATPARVLAELPAAAVVHFACHGVSDAENPAASRLSLAGGPLNVAEISRQRLPHARLALLLACHTARTNRLPDEAIHLASAFQVAGFPQVIGALWEAADLASVKLTEQFYSAIRGYGSGVDVRHASRALHVIVHGLRTRYAKSPAVWAPYMHTGC